MKHFLFSCLFISVFFVKSNAQEALTWHTDMDKAFEIAITENKPLMLFFTGSDWCGWCIRLQNEVFKTTDFKNWANNNVVLVELDFPRRKKLEQKLQVQNYQMQQIFNVTGYPSVFFAKPNKTVEGKKNLSSLGKTGYVRGGASKWLEVANNIVASN
ncbi:thioredoxin [Tamlana nanhaiensis]|uniref:Thioredoxin n=1 Tax=Neotamlana nanhaiensis TaxID=1382798 RepID=A0A0D7W0P0_9FLAO|nr:thioredoxin family protein [Tamlana nanhaiensis]KJD31402.1 thioredoxin [Tamlana nanhaiensis]